MNSSARCSAVHPFSRARCTLPHGHSGAHDTPEEPDPPEALRQRMQDRMLDELHPLVRRWHDAYAIPWHGIAGALYAVAIEMTLSAGCDPIETMRRLMDDLEKPE